MGVKIHLGSFGITGVKRSFSQKNAVTRPLYIARPYDSNMLGQPGVIWGHRGQTLIFTKNALSPLCYVLYQCNLCICIRLNPLQNLLAQISIWDHRGQKVFFHQKRGDLVHPPNLTRALGKGRMSSGTFVLAPFLTICFFFYKLYRISTKLGQNHQWVKGYRSYQQFDLKSQIGVTEVKNVKKSCFYGKCYSSYMLHSRVT